MRTYVFLGAIAATLALADCASAVVVEQQVTPAYVKENPKEFSIKVKKRDDGLIQFTVTRQLSRPQYFVASLAVREGSTLLSESNSPSFIRNDSATYYFAVLPKHLPESTFELSERSFGGDAGQEIPFPGGTDYKIRLKDFAPEGVLKESPRRN
jgi:hypothetical protein